MRHECSLFVQVYEEYRDALEQFGDVAKLPTRAFIEPLELGEEIAVELQTGKVLGIKLQVNTPPSLASPL